MAEDNEAFVLQAQIDNQLALEALDEMDEAAEKMARSGDESFQKIANQVKLAAKELRIAQQEVSATGQTFVKAFSDEGTIGAEEFRKKLVELVGNLKKVTEAADDSTIGKDLSGILGDLPKVDLDEIIQSGKIISRFEQLNEITTRLTNNISEEARQQGAALAASADALLKGNRTLDEMESGMKDLLTSAKELDKSFEETSDIDMAERLKILNAETALNKMKDRVVELKGTLIDVEMSDKLLNDANVLVDRLSRGQITAKEFQSSANDLTREFEKLVSGLTTDKLKPMDEVLNLAQTQDILNKIQSTIGHWKNETGQIAQAHDAVLEKGRTLVKQWNDNVITAEQFLSELKKLERQVNAIDSTLKDGASDPEGIAAFFKAQLATARLDRLRRSLEDVYEKAGEDTRLENWAESLIGQVDNLSGALDEGKISIDQFSKEVTDLSKNWEGLLEELAIEQMEELDKQLQLTEASAKVEELTQLLSRMGQSVNANLVIAGQQVNEQFRYLFNQFDRGAINEQKLNAELKSLLTTSKQLISTWGETKDTQLAEDLQLDIVGNQIENIKQAGSSLMDSADESVSKFGENVQKRADELTDLFERQQITIQEYSKEINNLAREVNKALSEDTAAEIKPIEDSLQLQVAVGRINELQTLVDRMGNSLSGPVRSGAADLTKEIEILTDQFRRGLIGPDELNKKIRESIGTAEELIDKFKETDEVDVKEALKLTEAENSMKRVRQVGEELFKSTNDEAKKAGDQILKNADVLQDQYDRGVKGAQQYGKEVSKLESQAKRLGKDYKEIIKVDLAKGLNVDVTVARIKNLEDTVKRLTTSTSADAQKAGSNIRNAMNELINMFNRGEMEGEELNAELKKLQSTGNELERTYGTGLRGGIDRATVSVWKMSNALDRMGVRGAGGALRVFDAIKGIHPALIAVTLAAAGFLIVLKKVGEAAVEAGKKLGKMVKQFLEDSVKMAENVETIELQLRNLFRGKADLARQTIGKILELSARLGVDLSDRLAATFLPLVDSFEMFERIGEIAATLSVKTGKSVEEVSRALQQGVAGQFRSLQYQFAVTGDWIDTIKAKQEELGETEGLIEGLEEYFEATGTGWDTYEGTLRRVRGQLIETFKLFKFEAGEPIKIALADELTKIGEWVSDNKDTLKRFFREVGDSVAFVVRQVGELIDRFLENFDQETFWDIADAIDQVGVNLGLVADNIDDISFDYILDSMIWMLETTAELISNTQSWLAILRAGGELLGLNTTQFKIAAATGPFAPVTGLALKGTELGADLITGSPTDIENAQEIINLRAQELEIQEQILESRRKARDIQRRRGKQRTDDQAIDDGLEINQLLQDRADLTSEVITATEELNEAYSDFNTEMTRRWRDIFIERDRRELDDRIEMAQKRIDLERKHSESISDIYDDNEEALDEHYKDSGRNYEDIHRKHLRKMREMDIDNSRKREDLLEKHLNKLKEIREKFDLDAEEAIRKNDAIALLRIRRRMELELRQENRRYDQSVQNQIEAEQEKKAELDRLLEDQIEDWEIANKRKLEDLQEKLEEQLEEERKKHRRSLAILNTEEQRKREALQLWEAREVEDFNNMWNDKNQDLTDQMAETVSIYENGVMELVQINARIAALMRAGVISASQIPAVPSMPVISDMGFWGITPTGTGLTPGPGATGTTGLGGLVTNPAGYAVNQNTLAYLIQTGIKMAQERGLDQTMINRIKNGTLQDVIGLINWMNKIPITYPNQRHAGGMINPGVQYMTGEYGPEPMFPMQHGIIAPHNPYMLSPQSQQAPNIQTDNSRNVTADISLLDPTHLSEIQKTLIRSIVTDEILRLNV